MLCTIYILQVNVITDNDDNEWIQAIKKEGTLKEREGDKERGREEKGRE